MRIWPETIAGFASRFPVRIGAPAARERVDGTGAKPLPAQKGLARAPRIASALHFLRASRLWGILVFSGHAARGNLQGQARKSFKSNGQKKMILEGERGEQIKRKARTFAPNLFSVRSKDFVSSHSTRGFWSTKAAPSSDQPWICTNHMHDHP